MEISFFSIGQSLETAFSRLQNAAISLDPKNLPNANGGISGERLSVVESLPKYNCVSLIGTSAKRRPKLTLERAAERLEWAKERENWAAGDLE